MTLMKPEFSRDEYNVIAIALTSIARDLRGLSPDGMRLMTVDLGMIDAVQEKIFRLRDAA